MERGVSNGAVLQSRQHAHTEIKGGYYEKAFIYCLLFRSVYKELHADHETGAADNK